MIEPSFTPEELDLTVSALREKRDRSTEQGETETLGELINYLKQVS